MNLMEYLMVKSIGNLTKKKVSEKQKLYNDGVISDEEWVEIWKKIEMAGGYDALEDE